VKKLQTPLSILEASCNSPPAGEGDDFLKIIERARHNCSAGLGTPAELFIWEISIFCFDMGLADHALQSKTEAPIEALRLAAIAMNEFAAAFATANSGSGSAALKAFAFFGIVSSTVAGLEELSFALNVPIKGPGSVIEEIKKSNLWQARNNFVHLHRKTSKEPGRISEFVLHDFRQEAMSTWGFRYRSRHSSKTGYSIRPFKYEDELKFLAWQLRKFFAECCRQFAAARGS
jgi:hypothetical protein